MDELADRTARTAVGDRLTARGIRRIVVSKVAAEEDDEQEVGLSPPSRCTRRPWPARKTIWAATKAGEQPDPGRRARHHRQPVEARLSGPHVAARADGAEAARQLHVHAHGERRGAVDGDGALARSRGADAARVRLRGVDARHRQGPHAARDPQQARQADRRRVQDHEAARRRRRARAAADAGDAGAGAGRRLRASPQAGSERLSRRTSAREN